MKTISPDEVKRKIDSGEKLYLIDVRDDEEVENGHIPGMIHIPLPLLATKINELDKNKSYIIVCRSGARSAQATLFLNYHGFDATNMSGGMLEWTGEIVYGGSEN